MIKFLSQQIIERAELTDLAHDPNVLELIADSLAICAAFPDIHKSTLMRAALDLREKVFLPSSKESQSVSQQLSDFSERLELVEAHLDELNDLLITAGIQDVQSSS